MAPSTAAAARPATPLRLRLRPTLQSDLAYVLSLESDPQNLPFITPWEQVQHDAAIRFPDFRHFIIESGPQWEASGFLIFIGCRNRHLSLELKRMVVQAKGQGVGRAALHSAKKVAFDDLRAHRLWLDVKQSNTRAQAFYGSEGFVGEGVLREAVRLDSGFDSLVVMSMLRREFDERRAQGLELAA